MPNLERVLNIMFLNLVLFYEMFSILFLQVKHRVLCNVSILFFKLSTMFYVMWIVGSFF